MIYQCPEAPACRSRSSVRVSPLLQFWGEHSAVTEEHSPASTRILGPAIVGALMQLAAMAIITTIFYLLARARYFPLGWPQSICAERVSCDSAALLVRLSYLSTAIGVALTNNRFISQAILWVRNSSQLVHEEAEAVTAQLSIVFIAALIETLDSPIHAVVTLGQWLGGIWLGAILWPAMLSVVIAAIGSLIHALYLSMKPAPADHA